MQGSSNVTGGQSFSVSAASQQQQGMGRVGDAQVGASARSPLQCLGKLFESIVQGLAIRFKAVRATISRSGITNVRQAFGKVFPSLAPPEPPGAREINEFRRLKQEFDRTAANKSKDPTFEFEQPGKLASGIDKMTKIHNAIIVQNSTKIEGEPKVSAESLALLRENIEACRQRYHGLFNKDPPPWIATIKDT